MNINDGSNKSAPNLTTSRSNPASKPRRLYSVWPANNRFLCGGRLIFGSESKSLYLTTFMIAFPSITFCIKTLIRVRNHDPIIGKIVLIIGIALTILAMLFLCMTSARDPGIIPRNLEPDPMRLQETSLVRWESNSSIKLPPTRMVKVNGHTIKIKYCETCHVYRPPRASHCSVCNNCVQKFDHHCPWVCQCIGLRNYRSFMMFISSTTLLCIYVFVISLISLLNRGINICHTAVDDLISVALALYCFIIVWFLGGLTVFHFYLICTNQTTYENFRYRYEGKNNPYNLGVSNNMKQVFLLKTPPSQVNFREWVVVEEEKCSQSGDDSSEMPAFTFAIAEITYSIQYSTARRQDKASYSLFNR
ncbi:LOW QUALITY PROTEIN: uncharacterized protein [Phyllobates terribilis]|uniref:LOW QUALITY PROTEIN: uncharacterized protein n=1 Tax=Phyllobates terribilis TaxID=111132 RepID=UPI003CCB0E27